MARDWTLIRGILEKIEAETLKDFIEDLSTKARLGELHDNFDATVARHIELLLEAGLVKGVQIGSTTPGHVTYVRIDPRMTMDGYDFLEILRNQSFWARVKERINALGVSITLEAIKVASTAILTEKL